MGGYSCVVSSFRLKRKANRAKLIWRMAQVCNHELGHTFGLGHCPSKKRLMADAKGAIKTVDKSACVFCDECKEHLREVLERELLYVLINFIG